MLRMLSVIVASAALLVATPLAAQELRGTLKKIKDSGTISIGVREASTPFSFKAADGNPAGYSVELCQTVIEAVRAELRAPQLKVKYVWLTPETRIPAVRDGRVDIECGSTTHTMTRRKQVDFSLPIFVDGASILSRAAAAIATARDLAGKRVAVLENSSTEAAVVRLQQALAISFDLQRVKDHDVGLRRLEAGEADAYISDRSIIFTLAVRSADPSKLAIGQEFLSYEPYALMMRRDADFRLVVDRTLARTFGTGQAVAIFKRWFGDTPPSGPLAAMFILNAYPQ